MCVCVCEGGGGGTGTKGNPLTALDFQQGGRGVGGGEGCTFCVRSTLLLEKGREGGGGRSEGVDVERQYM